MTLIITLLAAVVYGISLVLLARMLFRIVLWLLRYRRPELGTKMPDGLFSLVFGFAALAIAPIIAFGLVTGDHSVGFILALFGGALANGFGWVQLRISFSVALAELRYALARQRRLGAQDPTLEQEEREAEQHYRDIRHREQEQ